jgi:hypothetical protein
VPVRLPFLYVMGLLPPNHRPAAAPVRGPSLLYLALRQPIFSLFLDWHSPLLILVRKATLLYILVTFFLKALREDALWRHLNLLRSSIDSCSSSHAEHLPRLLYLFRHLIFFYICLRKYPKNHSLPPQGRW